MKTAFSFSKGKNSFLYEDKVEADRLKEEEKRRKKKEAEELLKKRKVQWEDECVKRMANDQPAISFEEWDKERKQKEVALKKQKRQEEEKKKKALKAKREEERKKEAEEDAALDGELTERELSQLRGYKKTKDGRITSYFTREQTEKDKKLLANEAPKRLEGGEAALPAGPSLLTPSSSNESGTTASAWNAAGTWEERDTTEWCTSQLKSRLLASSSSEGNCVSLISEVEDLGGDASVAIAGTKRRYIFDFHCNLKYEIRDFEVDEVVASGSLHLPDINSASHEEVEVSLSSWTKSPSSEYRTNAELCQQSLVAAVRSSVVYFVSDFNEKY